jgi:hypothetical protein
MLRSPDQKFLNFFLRVGNGEKRDYCCGLIIRNLILQIRFGDCWGKGVEMNMKANQDRFSSPDRDIRICYGWLNISLFVTTHIMDLWEEIEIRSELPPSCCRKSGKVQEGLML